MPLVPDRSHFDPELNVWMHTGENARDMALRFGGQHLATDIETPGLVRSFEINCVTSAWQAGDVTHTVLLDPRRVEADHYAVTEMYRKATGIILHNAPFDVPALVHAKLMTERQISKVIDTVVLARFGFPDPMISKSLGALAKKHLGMDENADGMKQAFKANGWTIDQGYERMDIGHPIYRQGAMLDTVATLRLYEILYDHAIMWSQNHPFERRGATTYAEAQNLIETQNMVHRVLLRRTARGLNVDTDYLVTYQESVNRERLIAEAELAVHGLEGGAGKGPKIVAYIESIGELPAKWPRTKTGKLSATKDQLEGFDHPLAKAQLTLSDIEKVMGWLEKVEAQATVTGRCHPQVGTLAASATGRMSYTSPPMQQFSAPARGIICDDGQGLTSIDWSQIEPITMGILAQDEKFLAPYEAGDDLYAPLMRAAGVDRPKAKIGLLADMYGQGEIGMAKRLGMTIEQAAQTRRQMRAAMPRCTKWMAHIQDIAAEFGKIVTGGGRILPVDRGGVFKAVNYVVQGTAYDVLAHTICEMERAGLGDHIQLAMHDELVVDTEVAEEVQRIMITPPPFFVDILGREPVLRSDRADMGHAWAKV